MPGVTLRIEGEGPTGSSYRVFLNDEEISNFTRAVVLNMGADDANTAKLEVFVNEVELSAEVQAELRHVNDRERTSFASRFRKWLRR